MNPWYHCHLHIHCFSSSLVCSPQGCRLRSSLRQQDVRVAAAHQVSECHLIFQNAAAGVACGCACNRHQTHQETEGQRR